jgi:ribose transport system ATP-binding protein
MSTEPLLHMKQISKSFPGVQALKDVDLLINPGEIMALVGENGAGKSTLMNILSGVYQADSGEIFWQGEQITVNSPHDAQTHGISMIHQELALIPYLNAGKNIYLGREPKGLIPGTINWKTLYKDAEEQLAQLALDLNVRTAVRFFPIAQQQMIEVAKALSLDASLIVMDEPTSSLAEREVETLFEQMRVLRKRGVAIIFITHRMSEIFKIADRVTVLRDGQFVDSKLIGELQPEDVIRMMVGREVGQIFEKRATPPSDKVALEVSNLGGGFVKNINFKLHEGEILGVAGLVGAGRTELAEMIFGIHPATEGTINLNGEIVKIRRPSQAIQNGIGLVPEDRKKQGLFLRMSVAANVVMAVLNHLSKLLIVPWPRVNSITEESVDQLQIRTPSIQQKVQNLSGGNQQKVVIAKWLTLEPKVLILDEPTRGIDVGAKVEIYRLINQLAESGVAILVISSELPEVLGISDRIIVMHEGQLAGEFDPETATQDILMQAATGTSVN